MKTSLFVISLLFSSTLAWPGYKSQKIKEENDDDCIDTDWVHNTCGPIRKVNPDRPNNIRYPSAF